MGLIYNHTFSEEKYSLVNKETRDIIDDYMIQLKSEKKSEGTIKQYFADLKKIAIWSLENLGNKSFLEFSKRDARAFFLYCLDEWKMSNARCNRLLASLRTCLDFCAEDDELYENYERNVTDKIKGLEKQQVRDIVWLTADDCEKLYNYFLDNKMYRDLTFFCLAIESAARKNELCQVLKDSITNDGNATNEVKGKRSKVFKLLYFDRTKSAAKLYLKERGLDDNPYLFINKNGEMMNPSTAYEMVSSWRPIIKELTGKECELNVHSLRHTALQLYSTGEHWVCKQRKLGAIHVDQLKNLSHHESSDTTRMYLISNEKGELENTFGIKLD